MRSSKRGIVLAIMLALTAAPILAGCVVVPDRGWHHGYWYHGRWYR